VLHIPPKEAKVFVTKSKALYLISIELYDPFEVLNEPLLLDFNHETLPAPLANPCAEKLILNPNLFILGAVPRNVVNLKLLKKKYEIKQYGNREITIANSVKHKKDVDSKKLFSEEEVFTYRKQKYDIGKPVESKNNKRTNYNNTVLNEFNESTSSLDVSIDPVLVTDSDIVNINITIGSSS